jgi:A/G-specific adenine glycosylase
MRGGTKLIASEFNARIFRWYESARRPLLVRQARTPWEVLVAEVMSQQTGIERVGPTWRQFVDRWPQAADLAQATTHELVSAWAGLGYNRRALALREAARSIVENHDGQVPMTVDSLRGLPGLGPYSARAVAAIAHGVPVAPLDVNVRRVVTRVLGSVPAGAQLQQAADELVSRDAPGRWVQAVMDLAVSVCTRKAPGCASCPLGPLCQSRGTPGDGPTLKTRPRFATTSRWLRGRLLAAVAEVRVGTWIALPDQMGDHDREAVRSAAANLARDGFLELRDGFARVRHDG